MIGIIIYCISLHEIGKILAVFNFWEETKNSDLLNVLLSGK